MFFYTAWTFSEGQILFRYQHCLVTLRFSFLICSKQFSNQSHVVPSQWWLSILSPRSRCSSASQFPAWCSCPRAWTYSNDVQHYDIHCGIMAYTAECQVQPREASSEWKVESVFSKNGVLDDWCFETWEWELKDWQVEKENGCCVSTATD
jgi:hypothetical protein